MPTRKEKECIVHLLIIVGLCCFLINQLSCHFCDNLYCMYRYGINMCTCERKRKKKCNSTHLLSRHLFTMKLFLLFFIWSSSAAAALPAINLKKPLKNVCIGLPFISCPLEFWNYVRSWICNILFLDAFVSCIRSTELLSFGNLDGVSLLHSQNDCLQLVPN